METYFDNMTAEEGSKQKLTQDLRILVSDSKNLLSTVGQKAGAEVTARAKVMDRSVRGSPYLSAAIAFSLGLLAGWLLGPRRD